MRKSALAAGMVVPAFFLLAAGNTAKAPKEPLGLQPITWPPDNPYSAEKVELGKLLFFDKRLSADGTVSCATCHDPKFAFTDGASVSTGIRGQKGGRSAPTIINRAWSLAQFWDGRAPTLEAQALGPMENPIEMGNTHTAIVEQVRGIAAYRPLFQAAFANGGDAGADAITIERVAKAITTFERTVMSGNSPYDRWKAGLKSAMPEAAVRGYHVFLKAQCDACHEGANFTSNMYVNIGIGTDKPEPDTGRYEVTKDASDWGVFKTPTLREVEHTGPYMHDGSLKTLEEVVDYYDKGGTPNKNLDSHVRKQHLTAQQKADLVAFLKSLSGTGWQNITAPASFPQ
jgi:cytochrome c peroxidase